MAHRDYAFAHRSMNAWMSASHAFGNHLPYLLQCCLRTCGPILELGIGEYSTPFLHAFASAAGRKVVSLDHDSDWVDAYAELYRSPLHRIAHDPDYQDPEIDGQYWSVIFVDHSEARREQDRKRVANNADFVVIHDFTSDGPLPEYRHRWSPPGGTTTVASNLHPLDWLETL